MGIQLPAAQQVAGALGLHRFRAGLEDEQLPREAILGPFQIHRRGDAPLLAVVTFDLNRPARQAEGLVVAEGKAALISQGHRLVA